MVVIELDLDLQARRQQRYCLGPQTHRKAEKRRYGTEKKTIKLKKELKKGGKREKGRELGTMMRSQSNSKNPKQVTDITTCHASFC